MSKEAEDIIVIRQQATADDVMADWEDLVRAVANCSVWKLEIAL
jgi:hypothetical protein